MFSVVLALVLIALWWAWEMRPRSLREPVRGVFTVRTHDDGRLTRSASDAAADEAEEIILDEIRRACEDGTMVLTREIIEGR